MKFRLFLASALSAALFACGGAGDDTQPPLPGDTDGDGISDADEGIDTNVDTDGDGTPDYQDADSDGDGIDDYRESGDTDPATAPVDSDGDGTPDFRDSDSDNNGRSDGDDGAGDADGDGRPDFADLDDDGDNIPDVVELGADVDNPVDTDGDGTPDFRDTDSDGDTILDLYDGIIDYDGDGVGNWRDLDSDGDCRPDQLEAGGSPPVDTDGDTRPDFNDRDSDDDGLADSAEDANCNGVRDGNETSATDDDSDGDGVSDLIEEAAGTNPNDAADNPQANGDFVFIEPYQAPQSPTDDDLDFSSRLQALDMYVILDRSGSMTSAVSNVRANLATVVQGLTCPPLGTGDPATCIPDLWAGAGTVGYSGSGAATFTNHVDLQPNPNFSGIPLTEPTGCCAEPLTFSVFAAVTGNGTASTSGCGLSGVNPRASCSTSPAAAAGFPTFGYPCFRQGALPVILLATDEPPLSPGDTNKCPDWNSIVLPQMTNRSAKLVGILGNASGTVQTDLQTMATSTGAVDSTMGNAPLVFSGVGTNAAAAIQNGIRTLANAVPLDLAAASTDDPSDSVDAVAAFVDHLETLQLGTAACANMLTDRDSNGDGFRDAYDNVRAGTPVCWKLVSKQNNTVPATAEPQLFRATVTVTGDGVTVLDTRDVFFLVPPQPQDPPIE